MNRPLVDWEGASPHGRLGLLARRMLQRVLRPLTVRLEAEHARLRAEVAETRDELRRIDSRLSELGTGFYEEAAFGKGLDAALNALLLRDLPPDRRIHRKPAGSCRRAICSLGAGRYRALLSRTALSYERYAERWGWELVLSTENLANGRPAPWGKVPLLRSLLDEYDWVLFLDADVVVVDLDADITTEVQDDKDLYLTEHHWDRDRDEYTANSGVMLMRSSDWSREFLDEVWASQQYIDHHWWENAAVLELLGYSLKPARLVRPTTWMKRTKLIDLRWNSVEVDRADRPAFVHRGLYDLPTRIRQVTADLQCSLGGADPITAGFARPARHIVAVTDVHRRAELPLLLQSLRLAGIGVVLGLGEGEFSEWLLDHWDAEKLISIDSSDGADAPRRLARFGVRSEVWRETSAEAAASFTPGRLDLVYLDIGIDEASDLEELTRWWPLARPGGVVAGSGYRVAAPHGGEPLQGAVDAFFGRLGLGVHATTDDPSPSWIVRKPLETQ